MIKTTNIVESKLSTVLVRVKCILLHYTKLPPEQLIRKSNWKMKFPEATKDNQQKDIELGQNDSLEVLSQTIPWFSLLIVAANDNFA